MGKEARLRAERRHSREIAGRPTNILRELLHKIRSLTHESPRRSWEMMLEIMGHLTGVNCLHGGCLTAASKKVVLDIPGVESILAEYIESWQAELELCKSAGQPVTDPIG